MARRKKTKKLVKATDDSKQQEYAKACARLKSAEILFDSLFVSGTLNAGNEEDKAKFQRLMTSVHDLMEPMNALHQTIKHPVTCVDGKRKDIKELIRTFRNSCCHEDAGTRVESEIPGTKNVNVSWTVAVGKGTAVDLNGFRLACEYEDDVAIFFGDNRIYARRHIRYVLGEAKRRLDNIAHWAEH